jgi:hypothetical protein
MKFQSFLLSTSAILIAFNMASANISVALGAPVTDTEKNDAVLKDAADYFERALANFKDPSHLLPMLERAEKTLIRIDGSADWNKIGTTEEAVKTLRVSSYYQLAQQSIRDVKTGGCGFFEATKEFLQSAAEIKGGSVLWEMAGISAKQAEKLNEVCATAAERKRDVLDALKNNLVPGMEITID